MSKKVYDLVLMENNLDLKALKKILLVNSQVGVQPIQKLLLAQQETENQGILETLSLNLCRGLQTKDFNQSLFSHPKLKSLPNLS